MSPRVLIAEPLRFCDEAARILEGSAEVTYQAIEDGDLPSAFARYDVVWLRVGFRIDATALGESPRCRLIAVPATGLDHIDAAACRAHGIELVSLKGEVEFLKSVRATAELAVGLILALVRKIPAAAASVASGTWNRDLFEGTELYEKTAGIVGVGRLGSIVADTLAAFGMTILGHDLHRSEHPSITFVSKAELLERSDVVTLHLALDETTRNFIGRGELDYMKRSAVLINTARGGLVDEAALLEALRSRYIAGAALDVLASEPNVRNDDPLIQHAKHHDNLLIVPHIGGKTTESMEKTEVFIATRVVERWKQLTSGPTGPR